VGDALDDPDTRDHPDNSENSENPDHPDNPIDARVAAVIELMDRHLADRLTLDELARAVNLSPSYLTQLFRRATGKSPARFWREMRLDRARQLLEASTLTARQAMDAVGWRDADHFDRDFRPTGPPPPRRRRRAAPAQTAEAPDAVNRADETPTRSEEPGS